jgi:glycosyltransferase involved in cell wall biosynthesis
MKAAYVFLPGRIDRINSVAENDLPSEFFYGALELRQKGIAVDILEAVEKPRRSIFRFLAERLLLQRYLPIKMYPSILDAVWGLLPKLQEYNVVVATSTGIAFSLVFWKIFYRLPFAVVGIISAIMNYPLNPARILLSRFLLKRMAIHLFGEGEMEPVCRAYGIAKERFTVNYFGVDSAFWQSSGDEGNDRYLLAVGNDSMRDFELLLEVARRVEKKVIVVTWRDIAGDLPANLEIVKGAWHSRELSDVVLRDMYRRAVCVIVPLKESFQPSGQSVTLQAMACQKPVILTRTAGLWDRNHLLHGHNIFLVDPGNVDQIMVCLQDLDDNGQKSFELGKNARRYVLEHARIEFFAERLETSMRQFGSLSEKQL